MCMDRDFRDLRSAARALPPCARPDPRGAHPPKASIGRRGYRGGGEPMEPTSRCISCGVPLALRGKTAFKCPACGNPVIGRCEQCRAQGVAYKCPECGFSGP
jgi:predicted RNA-binding Zn-ribbon protein involved in translation (DUF1610 family)